MTLNACHWAHGPCFHYNNLSLEREICIDLLIWLTSDKFVTVSNFFCQNGPGRKNKICRQTFSSRQRFLYLQQFRYNNLSLEQEIGIGLLIWLPSDEFVTVSTFLPVWANVREEVGDLDDVSPFVTKIWKVKDRLLNSVPNNDSVLYNFNFAWSIFSVVSSKIGD